MFLLDSKFNLLFHIPFKLHKNYRKRRINAAFAITPPLKAPAWNCKTVK